ncbi:fructoselysine 3-epimerase [Maioricimonas rarisocia]|uniref:Fructoselysine 3-epimerase n=1 Tax=Maioricimonas rarisocia TaxID=2528026 RepID=A0A517Z757_9PLAN|nr:sugar phosphate isomerase/epimerase family protein [Maioricimonas rarisocia]QDU38303.1 fructoselysine 3-epimerase [Maioricimonas rarisocia]
MKLGAMNHPLRDPIEEIAWIGTHDFDFVDFTLEPPATPPHQVDVAAVRDELDRHGLDVVGHTAWYMPIGFPLAELRRTSLDHLRECLDVSAAIGARVMNTHYSKPPKPFRNADAIGWHVEVLGLLCAETADRDMQIVLEHIPFGGADQLETIAEIMRQLPALGFHLDSGHAKLERSEDRFDEYLDRLGHRLWHVHISENDGTEDQHLPPGAAPKSRTDWPARIARLKDSGYDSTITLEVFADHREYLLVARDLFRQWWDAAGVPAAVTHV